MRTMRNRASCSSSCRDYVRMTGGSTFLPSATATATVLDDDLIIVLATTHSIFLAVMIPRTLERIVREFDGAYHKLELN